MPGDLTPEFFAGVSKHTGVPIEFLSALTIDAVWECAKRAVEWQQAAPAPPPPTAAVAPSMQSRPIPMQQLVPGDDWTGAWRQGRSFSGNNTGISVTATNGQQLSNP